MKTILLEEYNHFIVGSGAAGIAVAKLISVTEQNKETALIEQHFSPGGCSGYFSRGIPKRTYDAGATQLVGVHQNEIQYDLFMLKHKGKFPKIHKIDKINFYFPEDNSLISISSNNNVFCINENLNNQEKIFLQNAFTQATKLSYDLWKILNFIPKFPIYNLNDIFRNFNLILKLKHKIRVIFSIFLSTQTLLRIFGLKNEFTKSKKILNSLLLDTVQNSMENVPWLFGGMGLSILNYGIYRFEGGMRSYFFQLALQIQQNGLNIYYQHKLISISECEAGFILEIFNGKLNKNQNVLVKNNLFLNLTIWDFISLYKENNSFKKKLVKLAHKNSAWTAFALYGYFIDAEAYPSNPWYFQIFSAENELSELKSSLYVSIQERSDSYRYFTATIHINPEEIKQELTEVYKQHIILRIENALKVKILSPELATHKTFEKYTARSNGRVGGLIVNALNPIINPIPNYFVHKNKVTKLYLLGDSYFPGQGIISSTVCGINAWERAFKTKYSNL